MDKKIDEILKDAQEVDVGESWFKVLSLPNNVYGIHEPHHWQEVISYLIIGSEQDALFDTGMGIKDISKVIEQLTDLEVIVVNSHTHFDHVGDNHRFDTIYVFDEDRAIQLLLDGQPNEALRHDMAIDLFRKGYPEGFDPDVYAIQPVREEQFNKIHHGDVIDLGDRKLEVLHTPGHSTDSIMLLDRENRSLFTGDSVSAEEAEQLGIVNRVVPADDLEEETRAMSIKLSLVPPEVMRLTKQPINRTYEIMGLFEALKTNIDYSSALHTADIPELAEFERIIEEQGLKAALKWRESRYS